MTKGESAKEYFKSGYNCAQAVAMAFCDEMGMDEKTAAKLVSGYGGGMGRMREVCGTVSGMVFVLSALYGYDDASAREEKTQLYKDIQQLGDRFKADNGSLICRELLGLQKKGFDAPTPAERTNEYYKKRPCPELAKYAADILDKFIKSKGAKE